MISCENCNGACCRYLFIGKPSNREALLFLSARGAKDLGDGRLAIPSRCPMLGEKTGEGAQPCLIYASRPSACVRFLPNSKDCRKARKLEGFHDD